MIPSLIRTYVPLAVAYLVGWLASLGITVTSEQQAAVAGAIGTVAAALYYAAVRWAERRWPALTVLLGSSKQPAVYTAGPAPLVQPPEPDPFVKSLDDPKPPDA